MLKHIVKQKNANGVNSQGFERKLISQNTIEIYQVINKYQLSYYKATSIKK